MSTFKEKIQRGSIQTYPSHGEDEEKHLKQIHKRKKFIQPQPDFVDPVLVFAGYTADMKNFLTSINRGIKKD